MQNDLSTYSKSQAKQKHSHKKPYIKPALSLIPPEKLVFGVLILKNGKIILTNNYAKKLTGYSGDELIQVKFIDLFQADFQENIQRKIDRMESDDFPDNHFIAKTIDKYGYTKVVEVELSSFVQNKEFHIMAIIIDIKKKNRVINLTKEN